MTQNELPPPGLWRRQKGWLILLFVLVFMYVAICMAVDVDPLKNIWLPSIIGGCYGFLLSILDVHQWNRKQSKK